MLADLARSLDYALISVRRLLKQIGYIRSYTHNGKWYTFEHHQPRCGCCRDNIGDVLADGDPFIGHVRNARMPSDGGRSRRLSGFLTQKSTNLGREASIRVWV